MTPPHRLRRSQRHKRNRGPRRRRRDRGAARVHFRSGPTAAEAESTSRVSLVVLVFAGESLLGFLAPVLADLFLEDFGAQGDAFVAYATPGPAISLRSWGRGFPQNEQPVARSILVALASVSVICVGRGGERLEGCGVVGKARVRIIERGQETLEGAVKRLPGLDRSRAAACRRAARGEPPSHLWPGLPWARLPRCEGLGARSRVRARRPRAPAAGRAGRGEP